MTISELVLQTNNLSETEQFYINKLELKLIGKTENSISFLAGSSKLTFTETNEKENPEYHFAFNIPNNQLEEAINWTTKKLALIEVEENNYVANFENWNATAIYFFDNNKNILEFIGRTDLKNSSYKPFSNESILNISEIGVVTDDPLKLANQIIQQTKIDYFIKGPKSTDFAAIGTESGLFVISSRNRNWYPTKNKAEKQKVKASISIHDTDFNLEFN